jgi:urease accessory protein
MREAGSSERSARLPHASLEPLLALLQLADGLFPAGGFAHSLGLETYVQEGMVRDATGLAAFLEAQLEGSAGPTDAVAVACAARFASTGDLDAWLDLDARLDAMRWVPEFRAASVQMGRQTLRTVAAAGGGSAVATWAAAVADGRTPGHHAAVFGLVLGSQGVDSEAAAAAYLHTAAVLIVNAALRLLPLGQAEGQRLLVGARLRIARLAARAGAAQVDDLWSFAPGVEIAGLRHADLESRLFRS